jgi:PTS system mannose-specific IIB component
MAISFLRIDDRLIHGQMAASWIGSSPCDGIVVVDDEAAENDIQKRVLLSILPSIKTWVFSIDEAAGKLANVIGSQKKYYLIVRSPSALVQLADKAINKVNVGPLSKRADAIQINKGQGIIPEELPAFAQLKDMGFTIEFRLLPDTVAINWDTVSEKLARIKS